MVAPSKLALPTDIIADQRVLVFLTFALYASDIQVEEYIDAAAGISFKLAPGECQKRAPHLYAFGQLLWHLHFPADHPQHVNVAEAVKLAYDASALVPTKTIADHPEAVLAYFTKLQEDLIKFNACTPTHFVRHSKNQELLMMWVNDREDSINPPSIKPEYTKVKGMPVNRFLGTLSAFQAHGNVPITKGDLIGYGAFPSSVNQAINRLTRAGTNVKQISIPLGARINYKGNTPTFNYPVMEVVNSIRAQASGRIPAEIIEFLENEDLYRPDADRIIKTYPAYCRMLDLVVVHDEDYETSLAECTATALAKKTRQASGKRVRESDEVHSDDETQETQKTELDPLRLVAYQQAFGLTAVQMLD